MSSQEEEISTCLKMRTLISFFTHKPLADIDTDFDLVNEITEERETYLKMVSEALKEHFEITADVAKVDSFQKLGDLVNFIDANAPPA